MLPRCFVAAALVLAGTAHCFAHSAGKGIVVEEQQTIEPSKDDGYAVKPPEPETLGGAFELKDTAGNVVTNDTLKGRWALIYFGYPSCREACPVALENMTQALIQLGSDGDRIEPLFIDFSMERADPKGVQQFVSNFHPRLKGLVGTRGQIFEMVRLFKVRRDYGNSAFGMKETGPRIDHTTYFYLVDPSGVTRTYFYHTLPPEKMAASIREQFARPQKDAGHRGEPKREPATAAP